MNETCRCRGQLVRAGPRGHAAAPMPAMKSRRRIRNTQKLLIGQPTTPDVTSERANTEMPTPRIGRYRDGR
jgi:hypothetical protein